ncbi:MAG TPA: hypothetical protein VGM83_22260 [Devosiaceae bacterium]
MKKFTRALPLIGLLALAGCADTGTSATVSQPILTQPTPAPTMVSLPPPPAQTAAIAATQNTDAAAYVDPTVLPLMSGSEQASASSAQFYALQFGRPGAPRTWAGSNSKGSITVGPYVRVNNLDCRDFTNTVTAGGKDYVRKGTACREGDGTWSVVAGNA